MNRQKQGPVPDGIAELPRSYLALIAEFPLCPIKSAGDYERAVKIVHRLALQEGRLDAAEESYLEVLENLVERFDLKNDPINTEDINPTQMLRTLVQQAGMSVTELGKLLGSKGAASELLSGKRKEPSKSQIARLCCRFKVDASAFLLPRKRPASAA